MRWNRNKHVSSWQFNTSFFCGCNQGANAHQKEQQTNSNRGCQNHFPVQNKPEKHQTMWGHIKHVPHNIHQQKCVESSQRISGHKDILFYNSLENWTCQNSPPKKNMDPPLVPTWWELSVKPLVVQATARIALLAERRELYLADCIWDLPCLAEPMFPHLFEVS